MNKYSVTFLVRWGEGRYEKGFDNLEEAEAFCAELTSGKKGGDGTHEASKAMIFCVSHIQTYWD